MPHLDDDGYIVDDYDGWREYCGLEDSEETHGWYDCPDGEQSKYIEEHEEWWNTFGEVTDGE